MIMIIIEYHIDDVTKIGFRKSLFGCNIQKEQDE